MVPGVGTAASFALDAALAAKDIHQEMKAPPSNLTQAINAVKIIRALLKEI